MVICIFCGIYAHQGVKTRHKFLRSTTASYLKEKKKKKGNQNRGTGWSTSTTEELGCQSSSKWKVTYQVIERLTLFLIKMFTSAEFVRHASWPLPFLCLSTPSQSFWGSPPLFVSLTCSIVLLSLCSILLAKPIIH